MRSRVGFSAGCSSRERTSQYAPKADTRKAAVHIHGYARRNVNGSSQWAARPRPRGCWALSRISALDGRARFLLPECGGSHCFGLGQKTYRAGRRREYEAFAVDVDDVERATAEERQFVDDARDPLPAAHRDRPPDHREQRVQRPLRSRLTSIHDGTSTRIVPVLPSLDTSTSTAWCGVRAVNGSSESRTTR